MKILAIHGSPRSKSTTRALLDLAMESAREAGAEVEIVVLKDLKNITGCRGCYFCQAVKDEPACSVVDDISPLYSKALAADVIVWATPTYCWSPTWLAKIAIDRFACMFKFGEPGEVYSLLEGKGMAGVITCGGDAGDGADLVAAALKRMAKFANDQWMGALVAANTTTPDSIRSDKALVEKAADFGKSLVS